MTIHAAAQLDSHGYRELGRAMKSWSQLKMLYLSSMLMMILYYASSMRIRHVNILIDNVDTTHQRQLILLHSIVLQF